MDNSIRNLNVEYTSLRSNALRTELIGFPSILLETLKQYVSGLVVGELDWDKEDA